MPAEEIITARVTNVPAEEFIIANVTDMPAEEFIIARVPNASAEEKHCIGNKQHHISEREQRMLKG